MAHRARVSVIAAIIFLSGAVVPAQHPYGSAEDIEQFASALTDNKCADIAEEILNDAIAKGVQDPNGFLAYALCEVRAAGAFRTSDPAQRIAKLKEAVTAYDDYIKKFAKGRRAAEARVKLAEVLRLGGESVANQLKKETDPAKKEALKNEGINLFTKAEVLSKSRIEEIKAIPKAQVTEENQNESFALRFMVCRLTYSKALLYENRDGIEPQSLLNDARSQLEELDIDLTQGHPIVYEVRRLLALILVEQKQLTQAEETLTSACDELANAVKGTPDIVKDLPDPDHQETRDLIARMFLEKAEFLTKTKKPADWKAALDTTEQLNKMIPELVRIKEGKQCLVILAEALAEDGKTKQARTIAELVFNHDPSGDAGVKARELLDKRLGDTGGGGAQNMLKLLIGTVERGDIPQSERVCARILTSADARANPDFKADALLQLGGLYFNRGLYVYSGVIFNAIAEDFAASPRAPEAKFNEAMSFARQAQIDGRASQKYWKDKSKTARTDLINRFGTSKEAQDVSWFAANDAEGEEKFAEAVDLYLRVSNTSPNYGQAQYKAATLAFDLATVAITHNKADEALQRYRQTESALKNATSAFEAAAKTAINPAEVSKLKESMFTSHLLLAGLYIQKGMNKAKDALELLDKAEAEYKDDKARLPKVVSLKIKALFVLGRGRETKELVEKLIDVATSEMLFGVATAVEAEGWDKLKANEKDPAALELLKEAGRFYSLAVDRAGSGASKIDWAQVGKHLLLIGTKLSKLGDEITLIALDPNQPIAERSIIEHAKKAFEIAAPGAEVDLDRTRSTAFAAGATGKWLDAVNVLKAVTDNPALQLFDEKTGKVNKDAATKYPKLPEVYQDLAVAYIWAAKGGDATKLKTYCGTAKQILVNLARNSPTDGKRYWEARYLHLLALQQAHENAELDQNLDGLERSAPKADDGKFGIKAKIDAIRASRGRTPTTEEPKK